MSIRKDKSSLPTIIPVPNDSNHKRNSTQLPNFWNQPLGGEDTPTEKEIYLEAFSAFKKPDASSNQTKAFHRRTLTLPNSLPCPVGSTKVQSPTGLTQQLLRKNGETLTQKPTVNQKESIKKVYVSVNQLTKAVLTQSKVLSQNSSPLASPKLQMSSNKGSDDLTNHIDHLLKPK